MFCTTSALDIFAEPPISGSVEKTLWTHYQPISSLESGPLEYYVPGSASEYMDLSKTCLHLKLKILKADGTALADAAQVSTTNLLLQSLFKKVDVYLNDTLISDSSDTYAFKSYIQTLLNFSDEAKNTQLRSQLFFKESDTDVGGMQASDNSGYSKRKAIIAKSSVVELFGRLHVDLFHSDRYMVNHVGMKLSLTRNKPEFVVISTEAAADYRIQIESATLSVRKIRVSPSILIAHAKVLLDSPAIYPINQTVLKSYAIPKGMNDFAQQNIYLNKVPLRLVLGLVATQAFNGTYKTNPYKFAHFNLNYLTFYLDGEPIPTKAFTPDFTNRLYTREYLSTFSTLNLLNRDKGYGLSFDEYKMGNVFYAVDLTPDETAGASHFELARTGTLSFQMKFAHVLPENVTCVLLAEFESVITVDKNRAVSYQPAG